MKQIETIYISVSVPIRKWIPVLENKLISPQIQDSM